MLCNLDVWGSRDITPGILNFCIRQSKCSASQSILFNTRTSWRLARAQGCPEKRGKRKFLLLPEVAFICPTCTLVTMLTELAWLHIPQQKRGWACQTNSVRLLNTKLIGNAFRDSSNKRTNTKYPVALTRWILCNQHCSTVGQTALTTTSLLNIVRIYNSGSRHLVDTAAHSQSQNFKLHSWPIFAGLPVLNLTGGRRD